MKNNIFKTLVLRVFPVRGGGNRVSRCSAGAAARECCGQGAEHYVSAVATRTLVTGAHKSANCNAIELRFDRRKSTASAAFTMAEILLSLTIIGVVAAITLPSLTGNINERTWNTQRKALYARMSQAISLMPALNGFGTLDNTTDTATETLITNGLAKVLKINNICDNEHLQNCGLPSTITTLAGSKIATPKTLENLNSKMVGNIKGNYGGNASIKNTKAAAFETQNGESILVHYNPTCSGSLNEKPYGDTNNSGGFMVQSKVCINFIFDLNGTKGPNTVGKDIGFMSVLYPFDAQLYAPFPSTSPQSLTTIPKTELQKTCTNFNKEYRLPNRGELISMFVNSSLINAEKYSARLGFGSSEIFTPSVNTPTWNIINIYLTTGLLDDHSSSSVWCVKR